MRLAVDANIFVSELIRQRGRALIERSEFELFVAEVENREHILKP